MSLRVEGRWKIFGCSMTGQVSLFWRWNDKSSINCSPLWASLTIAWKSRLLGLGYCHGLQHKAFAFPNPNPHPHPHTKPLSFPRYSYKRWTLASFMPLFVMGLRVKNIPNLDSVPKFKTRVYKWILLTSEMKKIEDVPEGLD